MPQRPPAPNVGTMALKFEFIGANNWIWKLLSLKLKNQSSDISKMWEKLIASALQSMHRYWKGCKEINTKYFEGPLLLSDALDQKNLL